jgi:hypothetical protein
VTDVKTILKIEHVYRVEGPALGYGRSYKKAERFEALRYVGAMVPYRNGRADVTNPIEVFYSFSQQRHVLFSQGSFQVEELID